MAVIPITVARSADETKHIHTWSAVTESDTCAALTVHQLPQDISVAIYGTFGSATGVFKIKNGGGSGVNAKNLDGNTISLTAEGLASMLERPDSITPTLSGGTGQSVTVAIILWY